MQHLHPQQMVDHNVHLNTFRIRGLQVVVAIEGPHTLFIKSPAASIASH